MTPPRPLRKLRKRADKRPASEAKMSDVASLEQRIREALGRIDAGIERVASVGAPALDDALAEIAELRAALATERETLASEREARIALEAAFEALQSPAPVESPDAQLLRQIDAQSLDNQRLRASVSALREEVRRLSDALAEGLADPALVNHALAAELEALRVQRASETVEMADILAELDRIVTAEERAHA